MGVGMIELLDLQARYRHAERPIRRRIYYCRYRSHVVGSIKRAVAWKERQAAAEHTLRALRVDFLRRMAF